MNPETVARLHEDEELQAVTQYQSHCAALVAFVVFN